MFDFRQELRKVKDEMLYNRDVEEILKELIEHFKRTENFCFSKNVEIFFDEILNYEIVIKIKISSTEIEETFSHKVSGMTSKVLQLLKLKFEHDDYETKQLGDKASPYAFSVKI